MPQYLDTTTTSTWAPAPRRDLISGIALIVGAGFFLPSGLLHPEPGPGTALEQIHDMVTDPRWIPSAALTLAAFACFALAFARLSTAADLLARVLRWGALTSAAVAVGQVVYLFGGVGAEPLARDEGNWFSAVMYVTHLIVNPLWGLAVAAIALAGGLSRRLGGPVSLVAGAVGGLSWTVSMLTAPYLDIDDILFPVAGTLLTGWILALGGGLLRRGR
jgi:hypothetical protein